MNDRFLFRVWDKVRNKYRNPRNYRIALTSNGKLFTFNHDGSNTECNKDDFVIEQCTGLKDKNKQNLFGNDKFKIGDSETLICEWHNGGFGWWQYKGESYQYFIGFSDHKYLEEILADLVITGNIHDEVSE